MPPRNVATFRLRAQPRRTERSAKPREIRFGLRWPRVWINNNRRRAHHPRIVHFFLFERNAAFGCAGHGAATVTLIIVIIAAINGPKP